MEITSLEGCGELPFSTSLILQHPGCRASSVRNQTPSFFTGESQYTRSMQAASRDPLRVLHPSADRSSPEASKKRRSKTGCFACRMRHKKCEEQKPICAGCKRNHLLCSWPPPKKGNKTASAPTNPVSRNFTEAKLGAKSSKKQSRTREQTPPALPADHNRNCAVEFSFDLWIEASSPEQNSSSVQILGRWPVLQQKALFQNSLRFYVEVTAARLTVLTNIPSPFLNVLLPLACDSDDLLHAICALSSSHLSVKNEIHASSARSHYAVALRAAKYRITKLAQGDDKEIIHLFTLLLLLSHFEGIHGDMRGAITSHLMAARIVLVQKESIFAAHDMETVSFLLEQYFYLEIVSKTAGLGPHPPEWNPTLIQCLNSPLCAQMETSPTFGFMFGQSFPLFKLIPEVIDLAYRTSTEKPRCDDLILLAEFFRLELLIVEWEPYPNAPCNQSAMNGILYQQALLILLRCALNGPGRLACSLMVQVDQIIAEFIGILEELPLDSSIWANLMWPVIVVGSCLHRFEDQRIMSFALENVQNSMHISQRMLQLLRWIWDEPKDDTDLYGPFGITRVSDKHGVKLSMG